MAVYGFTQDKKVFGFKVSPCVYRQLDVNYQFENINVIILLRYIEQIEISVSFSITSFFDDQTFLRPKLSNCINIQWLFEYLNCLLGGHNQLTYVNIIISTSLYVICSRKYRNKQKSNMN